MDLLSVLSANLLLPTPGSISVDTTALCWPAAVLRAGSVAGPFPPSLPQPQTLVPVYHSVTHVCLPSPSLPPTAPTCPCSTASNSNRSSPACSPVLRKRSRSPTPQSPDAEAMVEKGSDHPSDKSPSTPEQGVQRSCSSQSGRSGGGKNSKVSPGSLSWTPLAPQPTRGSMMLGHREVIIPS